MSTAPVYEVTSDLAQLKSIVDRSVGRFPSNLACHKVDRGAFTIDDYHQILTMIFHQVSEGPPTFALAGANCPPRQRIARDYLLHHADEEKTHWEWIIRDLENTGYKGPDPRTTIAPPACLKYIAFNYYASAKVPIARLAIAAVLEGIGAKYGGQYARKIAMDLRLGKDQTQFYSGHADSDREHIVEIWKVLEASEITADEWRFMNQAAEMAGSMYTDMYNEAFNH